MGYCYRTVTLPISKLTDLRCKYAPSHINIVRLYSSDSGISLFLSEDQKLEMFQEGYEGAKWEDTTEKIYIPEWNNTKKDYLIKEYNDWDEF